jgi:uncharacterized protein
MRTPTDLWLASSFNIDTLSRKPVTFTGMRIPTGCAMRRVEIQMIVMIVVMMLLCFSGCTSSSSAPATEKVKIQGESFELELAVDDATRERGLKHRETIPDHGGMLFVFPDDKVQVQSFWMHQCVVDMDIIFLDPRGFVTGIHRMKREPAKLDFESESDYEARLQKYSSGYPAQFVIELKAGSLDRLNIQVDQKIELDVARLKAFAR